MLLLGFCLKGEREAVIQCWKEWRECVDLDDLDHSSFQIMSLAYVRLVELGIADAESGRIKGIHRYRWTQDQVARRGKRELLMLLQRGRIPTILLGGAALGATVYPEPAARTIADTEVMVPVARAVEALRKLAEEGWIGQQLGSARIVEVSSSTQLVHSIHGQVCLHWSRVPRGGDASVVEAYWRTAEAFEYDGVETHVLRPTDQFLHGCRCGGLQSSEHDLQWIADCVLIARQYPIDWARLADLSDKLQMTLHMRQTVAYLGEHFENSIRESGIGKLGQVPVTLKNRIEYFVAGRPDSKRHDLTHKFCIAACRYLELKWSARLGQFFRDFPRLIRLLYHQMKRQSKQEV
jgi:hypothetical protein